MRIGCSVLFIFLITIYSCSKPIDEGDCFAPTQQSIIDHSVINLVLLDDHDSSVIGVNRLYHPDSISLRSGGLTVPLILDEFRPGQYLISFNYFNLDVNRDYRLRLDRDEALGVNISTYDYNQCGNFNRDIQGFGIQGELLYLSTDTSYPVTHRAYEYHL